MLLPVQEDAIRKGYLADTEPLTVENTDFRNGLYTGHNLQPS